MSRDRRGDAGPVVCPSRRCHRPGARPLPRAPLAVRRHDAEGRARGHLLADQQDDPEDPAGLAFADAPERAGVLEVVVDSRERYAWKFEKQQVTLSRRALVVGDYAIEVDGETVGVVERKRLAELAGNVVDGSLLVTLGELATVRRSAIVVEDR